MIHNDLDLVMIIQCAELEFLYDRLKSRKALTLEQFPERKNLVNQMDFDMNQVLASKALIIELRDKLRQSSRAFHEIHHEYLLKCKLLADNNIPIK